MFIRYSHQKSLPIPEKGGSVEEILRFLPVEDPGTRLLIMVWICSIFLEKLPRPGIIVYGLQGSGKTTFAETLRDITDPSLTPTLRLPSSPNELTQLLSHHAIGCFDNLQEVAGWVSDELCRAVTGSAASKRQLYTDDEDFLYAYQRSFILNGISRTATKPDLIDRTIQVELPVIEENNRKQITVLRQEFEAAKPRIFGGVCDALSKAMTIKANQPNYRVLPRMADWTCWGMAIADALGYSGEDFYDSYEDNRKFQGNEVVRNEPVAQCLVVLMATRPGWRGSPEQLYKEIEVIAQSLRLDREKSWPKASNSFSKKLFELSPSLKTAGYIVDRKKTSGSKQITIENTVR
jgi:adenylate kinase family enzyme